MIHMKILNMNTLFHDLCLKRLIGVDFQCHCAHSYKGNYLDRLNPHSNCQANIELEDGVYYLCGKLPTIEQEKNFIFPFAYNEGSSIEYKNSVISITIENAAPMPILNEYIDPCRD